MNYFDSEAFIKEMESLNTVKESPMDYDEFEEYYEQITERELRGGM
jgi:hypothetical protein